MAKAVTFTAIDPNGIEHARTSKTKVYSHCVAARRSYDAAMTAADQDSKTDASNYDYFMKHLAPGYVEAEIARCPWSHPDHVRATAEREVARAQEIKAACPTKEPYVAERRAARKAGVHQDRADGVYDRWEIVGWCGRIDLAQKLASSTLTNGYHGEARVLNAVQR